MLVKLSDLVEDIAKLRSGEYDEGQEVADESRGPDDGHEDAVEPEPVVIVLEPVAAVARPGEHRLILVAQLVEVRQVVVQRLLVAFRRHLVTSQNCHKIVYLFSRKMLTRKF